MEETVHPPPPFAIVLSNLWIAYGFIQTVLERRPGDVHRLVRVVIEFQQVREQKGLCYSIYSYGTCHDNTGYFGVYTALGRETEGQALDTILAVIREP
ncbi:insulinase family protein, partial [Flavonifractor plautii]|uniref:insulinase family protein n=2 Tax=Flavonifractor plautii TaxID=292800 RepID=UPI001A9B3AC8